MSLELNWAATVTLTSAFFTLAFSLLVWGRREAQGRQSLTVVVVAASVWGVAYAFELASTDVPTAELWGALKYVGITLLPAAWLVFTLHYTGHERWVAPRWLALLAVEPVAVLGALALPATRHWVRFYPDAQAGGPIEAANGALFWIHFSYSSALLVLSAVLFVVTFVRVSRFYHRQSVAVLAGLTLPWATNALNNAGIGAMPDMDLTPLALSVGVVILGWGVLRLRLLDVVPVARPRIIETMRDAVLVLDAHRRVIDVNPAAERLLDRPGGDAIGQPAAGLVPDATAVLDRHAGDLHATEELRMVVDGGVRHLEVTASWLSPASRDRRASFLVLRDITERKEAEESLERLAHHDVLTGLPNRKLAADRLSHSVTRARRNGELVGLLMVDLDRFKRVNDSLGHDVGDGLLRQVAGRLLGCLREQDTVSRLGGDEFTVLLPDLARADDAGVVATKMLEALGPPFHVEGWEVRATASIGIAVFPQDGHDPLTLLRRADAAMYRAKRRGRNRHETWSAAPAGNPGRDHRLEADLEGALARREMRVDFQPAAALADGRMSSVEALMRWQHPARGALGPVSFLLLAEERGTAVELGDWVLQESCAQAARWRTGGWVGAVSVNLSGPQLADPDLTDRIDDALHRHGLGPDALVVEVSERIVGEEPGYEACIRKLKQVGVGVALDDFGTGGATLDQLRRLPLDQLKLDPLLVREVARNPDDRLAVAATINLAHTLGLVVVAEGVEHDEQRAVLTELGCDGAQGHLFAPPLPADRILRTLLRGPV